MSATRSSNGTAGGITSLRGAELYVVICVFLNLFKWVYMCGCEYFLRGRFPFQDEGGLDEN